MTVWPIPAFDLALAAAFAAGGVAITVVIDPRMPGTRLDAGGATLIAAAALALVVRRRWPIVAAAGAIGATTVYLLFGYTYGPIMASLFVGVYSLARYCPPRRSAIVAAVGLVALLTHLITNDQALRGAAGIVPGSAWIVVPYAIGLSVRLTRQAREQERARAITQQVAEERMRLAQDVHDIVGHNIAAIKMQADIALHVMRKNPGQAEAALRAISGSSGDALGELRIALTEMTSDDRSPTPGLARLDQLTQRMRAAGMDVHVETTGTARPLPEPVDIAAYRVLQESLTNVLRHGPTSVARVRIRYEPTAVTLTVGNPVPADFAIPSHGRGLGLAGMRRRVSALGGEFRVTAEDGWFEVMARLS